MTISTATTLSNFVNGEWVTPSGEVKEGLNPADTREVVSSFRQSTSEDVKQALDSAAETFKTWKNTPAPQRGAYLYKIAALMEEEKDELAKTIVQEEGKTYNDAAKEVGYAAGIVKFYAGECRRLKGTLQEADMPNIQIETKPEPLGVVLVVTPWNFPMSIPAWKTAPAIASGNTVVLKPSSETPLTVMKFMDIIQRAGVPAGVVNQVIAPGKLVPEMIHHPSVKAVTFTGSNSVGKKVYAEAAKDMKRCLLEMGGKNPLIVMDDADLDEAVQLAVAGAYGQTGQACTATGRVIVHEKVAKEFTEKLVAKTKEFKVGNGMEEGINMGPQVSESERQSTLDLIQSARDEGATVLTGGKVPEGAAFEHGYFVEPTVISGVKPSMTIAQQEVFGPVNSIIEVRDIDEAIEVANNVDYGLSSSICTKNLEYMNQALAEIEAGIVKVNMTTTGTFFQAPFGGYKQSSTGTFKELGSEALDFYCQYKTRYIKSK
ncbi:aldehyde dehydrogenase family protein [Lentibacillus cibarius]|uniref:3-sulfolactaldehyde dehydrogenase n=1 Tax=Lentibacillus cibarius TaxID=2583219 RepID=A0A549YF55_9BACI|nr:aldehyde dehydrogenase family protein [Lentibacillus cibarius]TRM10519.1 aldehyde dehydrogenase family protein [Lentibacillus cibarius]